MHFIRKCSRYIDHFVLSSSTNNENKSLTRFRCYFYSMTQYSCHYPLSCHKANTLFVAGFFSSILFSFLNIQLPKSKLQTRGQILNSIFILLPGGSQLVFNVASTLTPLYFSITAAEAQNGLAYHCHEPSQKGRVAFCTNVCTLQPMATWLGES